MKKYVIGVDLGGTNIKAAIFDLNFQFLRDLSIPTEAAGGPPHVLNRIKGAVKTLLSELGASADEVVCMGCGVTGIMDPEEGLSIFSPNFPNWRNVHVVNIMKETFDFPVFIDNDVRVNLYGEWWFGAGVGYRNLMLITLGTGLGSGIVNEGKVVYGTTASAGELGHMNMFPDGPPCGCGGNGCLETYASATGMVNTMKRELAAGKPSIIREWTNGDVSKITARMISEAFDAGDPLAIEVMRFTGVVLGTGLANAINLLNPQLVIVGGGMAAAGDRLLNTVRETINKRALPLSAEVCRLVTAQLGERAGMIGAAAYAYKKAEGALGQ
jgi:glucokinase